MLECDSSAATAEELDETWEKLLESVGCRVLIAPELLGSFKSKGVLAATWDDARRFPRFYYQSRAILSYQQSIPALKRSGKQFVVITRTLSRTGISFLHEQQLFPCEQLKLTLGPQRVFTVRITRCQKLGVQCYEVGAKFV